MQIDQYVTQASEFLASTGTTFKAVFKEHDLHFPADKEPRDIYRIFLKNKKKSCSFLFGQSISKEGIAPTQYDVLAVLTKSDPGTFNEFINEFGYDVSTVRRLNDARKTYNSVVKEWEKVAALWTEEEITQLQEIN